MTEDPDTSEEGEKKVPGVAMASKRKVVRLGGASYISVPRDWMRQHNVEDGDELYVLANSDIRICHPRSEQEIYDMISDKVKHGDYEKSKPQTGCDPRDGSDEQTNE